MVPPGSPLAVDGSLAGVAAMARDGRVRRFAIANPEHAPYGRAAQEALTAVGAWVTLRPRLVLGENVAQAMQFATSGSTDGGIVALSLALAPGALGTAAYAAVPGGAAPAARAEDGADPPGEPRGARLLRAPAAPGVAAGAEALRLRAAR